MPAVAANAKTVSRRDHQSCAPPGALVLLASPQAQVYAAPERKTQVTAIYGCANGRRRSFLVAGCDVHQSGSACARSQHVTLAGDVVACESGFVVGGNGVEPGIGEWYVAVNDLRTGRLLRQVPTGMPRTPEAHYVGVGNIVALALRSDGAVAWIADDYERSLGAGPQTEIPYFDVEAADSSGVRLLAAGTDVDPASLALGQGATNVGALSRSVGASLVYWTQGGKAFSAPLG
jgi:hypothetical protein